MSNQTKPSVVDGRRLRSERSKRAIIDACLALNHEGVLVPTAQQISDRAGVPIRSFFRHFEDMESIFRAIDAVKHEWYESYFPLPEEGLSFDTRLRQIVEMRAVAFEAMNHIIRSTLAQRWRYAFLQENYARYQLKLRKNLKLWLPEISQADTDALEMADSLLSFEMWERLRIHQRLSVEKSKNLIEKYLSAIFNKNLI